ncbi:DUF1878 domain-containing protein [Tepidibacter aestuarii]|uniref:DUF1878 domain-containing protein n=1 Tax=Tepidibacter aestuarii TaxID=2925782 RepID=UPI0020BFDB7E|nr:DUF1878 domain-containing protein [Tepidibacter aestuarii]CAH2213311.1 protein of unknown function [Tepidibacter aestuarii]
MCGIDIDIMRKFDFIEFRQDLLFRNTGLDRVLFEYEITRKQYDDLKDLMNNYEVLISKNEEVNHNQFEQDIYNIVIQHSGNTYFVESLVLEFYKQGMYKAVFTSLYSHMDKFKSYNFNK